MVQHQLSKQIHLYSLMSKLPDVSMQTVVSTHTAKSEDEYSSVVPNLIAMFQCVFPFQSDLMALHVDVEVLLVCSALRLGRFSQPVEHLVNKREREVQSSLR